MIFLSERESVSVVLSFVYIRLAVGDPVVRCGMVHCFLCFLTKRVRQRSVRIPNMYMIPWEKKRTA